MSPVRNYRPTTNARRGASMIDRRQLAESPKKSLTRGKASSGGRNNTGRISVRHKGGGVKKNLRTIDFIQDKAVPATVASLEYDPYRSAYIALLKYTDGDYRYVLAEGRLTVGQRVQAGAEAPVATGNRIPLRRVPGGSAIFNIQAAPGRAGTLVRAAGSSATVVAQEAGGYTQVKMPSGEVRRLPGASLATLGVVSNREHENVTIGSAGRNRRRGIRPTVRGKAMNPTDHPHGGGEGAQPIGLKGPKTPSGLYTLGRKTRRKNKQTRSVVRARR